MANLTTDNRFGNVIATVSLGRMSRETSGDWFVQRNTVEVDMRPTGSDLEGGQEFSLPASASPTTVFVKTSVSAEAIRDAKSSAAIALDRRRKARQIAKVVSGLPAHAHEDDFHSFVYPVFDSVRSLLLELSRYERLEGNTCMMLRNIRNSLIHPGWERYREGQVCDLVSEILRGLASVEIVTAQDAKNAFRKLHSMNLRISLPVSLTVPNEAAPEEGASGKEDSQVFD